MNCMNLSTSVVNAKKVYVIASAAKQSRRQQTQSAADCRVAQWVPRNDGGRRGVHDKFEPTRCGPPFCLRHAAVAPPCVALGAAAGTDCRTDGQGLRSRFVRANRGDSLH